MITRPLQFVSPLFCAVGLILLSAVGAVGAQPPELVIAIDPGHGGRESSGRMEDRTLSSANNAKTPSGVLEKTLTLELSKQLAAAIQSVAKEKHLQVRVRLTRHSDENPDFAVRAKRCLEDGPAPTAIVSIHFNALGNHSAKGSVAMIAAADHNPRFDRDKLFANRLTQATSRAVSEFVPDSRARAPITDSHLHGGKGSNFFFQLQRIPELRAVPACFLEVEFIDREDVERLLIQKKSAAFPKIARAVAEALLTP